MRRRTLQRGMSAGAANMLRNALALWRGPALSDFTYDDFAQPEIARLEELRVKAIADRIDADLACGRHAAVVAELEALVVRASATGAPPRPAHARPLSRWPPS